MQRPPQRRTRGSARGDGRFTTQVREDLRNAQRTVRARIRELMLSGVQAGALFTSDVALATFVLASALEGVLSQWVSSPRDAEPFCDPETLVDFLLTPYETGRAPGESPGQEKEAGADFLPPF